MHQPLLKFSVFIFILGFATSLKAQDKLQSRRALSVLPLGDWRFHLGEVKPMNIEIASETIIDLSKDWGFQTDPKNLGIDKKWFSP